MPLKAYWRMLCNRLIPYLYLLDQSLQVGWIGVAPCRPGDRPSAIRSIEPASEIQHLPTACNGTAPRFHSRTAPQLHRCKRVPSPTKLRIVPLLLTLNPEQPSCTERPECLSECSVQFLLSGHPEQWISLECQRKEFIKNLSIGCGMDAQKMFIYNYRSFSCKMWENLCSQELCIAPRATIVSGASQNYSNNEGSISPKICVARTIRNTHGY